MRKKLSIFFHRNMVLLTVVIVCSLFVFARKYQLPFIGNPDGLDTINMSGAVRTNKALILKDTFALKPGDFLQVFRNSSKLTYIDSAGRAYCPEVLIGTTTRTGDKLIVSGDALVTGTVKTGSTFSGFHSSSPFTGAATPITSVSSTSSYPFQKLWVMNNTDNSATVGLRRLGVLFGFSNLADAVERSKVGGMTYESTSAFGDAAHLYLWYGTVSTPAEIRIDLNNTYTSFLNKTPSIEKTSAGALGPEQRLYNNSTSASTSGRIYFEAGDRVVAETRFMRTATSNAPGAIAWYTRESDAVGLVEKMRLSNLGYLGVITTAPTSAVDITPVSGAHQLRLRTTYTPTGTADTSGNTGDVGWDADYWYVKTAAGWKRTALSTW